MVFENPIFSVKGQAKETKVLSKPHPKSKFVPLFCPPPKPRLWTAVATVMVRSSNRSRSCACDSRQEATGEDIFFAGRIHFLEFVGLYTSTQSVVLLFRI